MGRATPTSARTGSVSAILPRSTGILARRKFTRRRCSGTKRISPPMGRSSPTPARIRDAAPGQGHRPRRKDRECRLGGQQGAMTPASPSSSQRRVQRRNVRSLTSKSSAASSWFSSADSQQLRMFENIAMRTPLKGLRPAHPNHSKKGQPYRTDRALPKPDISCARDSVSASRLTHSRRRGRLQWLSRGE
jgi:hypothetical protein